MMFVDDSIWPTKSAGGMQKVIRLHETFCEFHKIFIHKNKSEYISINAKNTQVRWNPSKKLTGHTSINEEIEDPDPLVRARNKQKAALGSEFKQKQAEGKHREGDNQAEKNSGNQTLKYLGVWFDTNWGWHVSQAAEPSRDGFVELKQMSIVNIAHDDF